jgi:hypothetical protein
MHQKIIGNRLYIKGDRKWILSKLQWNDKTFIYILEKVTDFFFVIKKKTTSYPYKIDIENQLIFRAQFTYTVIYL